MFKENDTVLYSQRGVCKIIEKTDEFYTLAPIKGNDVVIKIPLSSEGKLKKTLSKDEIDAIIKNFKEVPWIENDKERQIAFRDILASSDRQKLIGLIKVIYIRQQMLKKNRKKLHVADEKIFKEAENVLYDEFAFVLDLERESVVNYIAKIIG